jgi:hypothetical protein
MSHILEMADAFMMTANVSEICFNQLNPNLANFTRRRRFVKLFGIHAPIAATLWFILDVHNDGPEGGRKIHLLWTLMMLKSYDNQDVLAMRAGVDRKTFRKWTNLFLNRISKLDMVSLFCSFLFFKKKLTLLLCFYYFTDRMGEPIRESRSGPTLSCDSRWLGFSNTGTSSLRRCRI